MSGSPRVFVLEGDAPDPAALAEAAKILRGGGLVVFPTETVYGLGADATNPKAIERLNQVKGRPPEKPYSLHLHAADQMRTFVSSVPPPGREAHRTVLARAAHHRDAIQGWQDRWVSIT